MSERRRNRRMMSDINVVPYIDVMLVLLIIFMITAPLITQGVRIELPQAPSEVLPPSDNEPVVVSVDAAGAIYVDIGENPDEAVSEQVLVNRVAAVLRYRPETEVMVEGDRGVDYGRVVQVMSLLQGAGVKGVGLITEPLDGER
ncbi:MAG: protein TolR [Gammaproteobacteria bacterium]